MYIVGKTVRRQQISEDMFTLESKGKLKDVKFIHRQRIEYRKKGVREENDFQK